jgi:hypothetical protein
MSPGRFKAILSDQLRLSEGEFWDVLRTKAPALRPSPASEREPRSLPLWLALALEREVGLTREQIPELMRTRLAVNSTTLDRDRDRDRVAAAVSTDLERMGADRMPGSGHDAGAAMMSQ